MLLTLWVFGTSEGIAHASVLAERCRRDDAYRWVCGGQAPSERTLSSFRRDNLALFESVFRQVIASLRSEGLIELTVIAQDGTRVRASAGVDSYRRLPSVMSALEEANARLVEVRAQAHDMTKSKIARAAAERGARERVERLERAATTLRALQAAREVTDEEMAVMKGAPRVSTTDPEAVRMKMPDGGFRPAYNVQFATTADAAKAIVGVDVLASGNDFGQLDPMRAKVEATTGETPQAWLADGGYAKKADIEAMAAANIATYTPEPKKKPDPQKRTAREQSAAMVEHAERIASPEGKALYALRGETAELSNAHAKSRFGMSVLTMRGLAGALITATLVSLTTDAIVLIRERRKHEATTTNVAVNSAPSRA